MAVDKVLRLSSAALTFFLIVIKAYAIPASEESLNRLAHDSGWLKLVHYRGWLSLKSEIEADFFLAPDGRTNPSAEIQADYAAIETAQKGPPAITNDRVECRFPARFLFLQRRLKQDGWQMPNCPAWQHFSDGIEAKSVTLVFSSYFLNNPSSAFGHTFLRLNRGEEASKHRPLLDYGIGFALSNATKNPLWFAIGSLFGLLPGEFSSIPYYFKVQEYSNFESRDLWEYDLSLTPDEIQLLVAHIWELSHAQIFYRYLSENCSSMLLSALEAAAPRLDLRKHLPYWVIPVDTVKALYKVPGLVQDFRFRPSKRSQFLDKFKLLAKNDQNEVVRTINRKSGFTDLRGSEPARELDAMIDYYDFRYFKELMRDETEIAQLKQEILIARSQLPAESFDPKATLIPEDEIPQTSHPSARFELGTLTSRLGERSLLFAQRFALHDHLDPQQGYPRDSEIDFLKFSFRALLQPNSLEDARGFTRVEQVYAFAVKSYVPYHRLTPNISWQFRLGAERTWDESCLECTVPVLGSGAGYSLDLTGRDDYVITLLAATDLSASSEYVSSPVKLRLGPELNFRAIVRSGLVFQLNAEYLHLFFALPTDAYRIAEEVRYAPSERIALGLGLSHLPRGDVEAFAKTFFYY